MDISPENLEIVRILSKAQVEYPQEIMNVALTMEKQLTPVCIEAIRQIRFGNTWEGEAILDESYTFHLFAILLVGAWNTADAAIPLFEMVSADNWEIIQDEYWEHFRLPYELWAAVLGETICDETVPTILEWFTNPENDRLDTGLFISEALSYGLYLNRISLPLIQDYALSKLMPIASNTDYTLDLRAGICDILMEINLPESEEVCRKVGREQELSENVFGTLFDEKWVDHVFADYAKFIADNLKTTEITYSENSSESVRSDTDYWNYDEAFYIVYNRQFVKDKREEKTNRMAGTIVHQSEKIGRNDLCPCGSGKKYKKCCLK